MASWHESITWTVEIAFASTPLATSPTWTDVSDYVREVPSIVRGRNDEYSDFAPGTATVVLDNQDRRFDPDYTSGAYYPNVVPMKRIKITWALGASSGTVFTGFVLGWPQEERIPADGFVTITAVDGSRMLQNVNLPGGTTAYASEVDADSPSHYWPMQSITEGPLRDEAGSINLAVQGHSKFHDGISSNPLDGFSVAAQAASVASLGLPLGATNGVYVHTGSTRVPSTLPNTIELWFRPGGKGPHPFIGCRLPDDGAGKVREFGVYINGDPADPESEVTMTFTDADNNKYLGGASYPTTGATVPQARTSHIVVTASATDIYVYINGVQRYTAALTLSTHSSPALEANTLYMRGGANGDPTNPPRFAHVAFYTGQLSAARVAAHYAAGIHAFGHPTGEMGGARIGRVLDHAGWPSALRDLDTGGTVQGQYLPNGQLAIDYIRQVERSEQGLVYFDVDGKLHFRDREALWNLASSATFTDDGNAGDLVYVDAVRGSHHDTIRNIVTCSYSTVGGITRRDSTSITNYGEARELVQCPTIPDATTASNLAKYVLDERKDPSVRIAQLTVPVRITGGDNEAETLLALDIGDKITVERTPMGVGSQVAKTVLIQGIEHQIDENQWTVTFYTSPAPTSDANGPYYEVGHADRGDIGAAAGNVVPF